MEVTAEAKRIMVVALGKLYSSRTQRGGLRLHRSLLLTLVMKSARDMYHAAQATAECVAAGHEQQQQQQQQQQQEQQSTAEGTTESPGAQMELQVTAPLDRAKPRSSTREEVVSRDAENKLNNQNKGNKENLCPGGTAQRSRKRRGKAATEPDFLPCKKAKLEQATCPQQLGGVNPLWLDYASCSNILGATSPAVPVHRAIAAC